jgi:hypothetical protein
MKITTFVGLKEQYNSTVASVVQELVDHPDFTSEEIANKSGLSKEELLACYDIIQGDSELQRIIIEDSKSPRLTILTSDLITQYPDYLARILSGSEVYPLILEFHPGPVCQCQCKFCFSDGWHYAELAKPEEPVSLERVLEVFDECRRNGVEEVWFSGGKEPFINPLTPEYIRRATSASFNLSAGAHTFEVRCFDNGGAYSSWTTRSFTVALNNPPTRPRLYPVKLGKNSNKRANWRNT